MNFKSSAGENVIFKMKCLFRKVKYFTTQVHRRIISINFYVLNSFSADFSFIFGEGQQTMIVYYILISAFNDISLTDFLK